MQNVGTLRLMQFTPPQRELFTILLMGLATLVMVVSVSLARLKIELMKIAFAYSVSFDSTDYSDAPLWTIKREPHAEIVP